MAEFQLKGRKHKIFYRQCLWISYFFKFLTSFVERDPHMDSPEAIRVKEKYKASFVMLCPDWPKKLQISSPLLASFQFTQFEVPSSLKTHAAT